MVNIAELADRALQRYALGSAGKQVDRQASDAGSILARKEVSALEGKVARAGSLGRDRLAFGAIARNASSTAASSSLEVTRDIPQIDLKTGDVGELFGRSSSKLEQILPDYLVKQRWFAGKTQAVQSVKLLDAAKVGNHGYLTMLKVSSPQRPDEIYALGLSAVPERAASIKAPLLAPLARVKTAQGTYVLSDAMGDPSFSRGLIEAIHSGRTLKGTAGAFKGVGGSALDQAAPKTRAMSVTPLSLETSNTSVRADQPGTSFVLKLTRRHDAEIAPGTPSEALDVWKGAFLTDHTDFRNTPRVFGTLVYVPPKGPQRTVSVLSEFVRNEGDSWTHALAQLKPMLELAGREGADHPAVKEAIERYAAVANTHGRRLGQLHVALSSGGPSTEFRAVKPGALQLAQETAALRADATSTIDALRRAASGNGPITAQDLADLENGVQRTVQRVSQAQSLERPADLIHAHGDFHLGQMLHTTGNDVQIIDLEGAPSLPVAQRWQRSSALTDVARQRSSYEYAAEQAVRAQVEKGASPEAAQSMREAASQWAQQAKDAFMAGWKAQTQGRSFVPDASSFASALRRADFSNALYETRYELGSRPDWVGVPLARLRALTASVNSGARVVSLKPSTALPAAS